MAGGDMGACMAGGCAWKGGMDGRGHAWEGDMCGRGGMHAGGHAWQGACVAHMPPQ